MVRNPKFCVDPLQIHKRKIKVNLQKVSQTLAEKFPGTLTEGHMVCKNCLQKIYTDHSVLNKRIESPEDTNSDTCSTDVAADTSSSRTSEAGCLASANVSRVLPLLEQTPVRRSK